MARAVTERRPRAHPGWQSLLLVAVVGLVAASAHPAAEETVRGPELSAGSVARPSVGAGDPHLLVMVFNHTAVPLGAIEATLSTVEELLGSADLDVRWLRCIAGTAPPRDCVRPAPPGSLVLRFLPPRSVGDEGAARQMTLGFAAVDENGFGVTAHVYMQPANRFAGVELMPSEQLAGLVAAHELAHLLIGKSDHAPTGLMRAVWPLRDLQPGRRDMWRFSSAEAERLQEGVRRLVARRAAVR